MSAFLVLVYLNLKSPKTLCRWYMHTWKKRKKQHKRIFSPKKLAQKQRKPVNIQICDKTA